MKPAETLDYILNRFSLEWKGCLCGHLPAEHDHEVKQCAICECDRYHRSPPLEIPDFGRNQLAGLFRELGFTTGAEVGVKRGEYSEVLCKANPNLHLYCVDAWTAYEGYRLNHQRGMDQYFAEATKRMKPFNCTLIRKFSIDAARDFEDRSLDFVYIDAAHDFVNVVNDLDVWTKKVRPGGLICGHDYIKRGMGPTTFGKANKNFHVQEAVDAYTLAFRIDPFFVLGRKEIVEGEIRDSIRSFMWVNE